MYFFSFCLSDFVFFSKFLRILCVLLYTWKECFSFSFSRVSHQSFVNLFWGTFFGGFVRSENRLRITKTKWKNTNRRNKLKQKLN